MKPQLITKEVIENLSNGIYAIFNPFFELVETIEVETGEHSRSLIVSGDSDSDYLNHKTLQHHFNNHPNMHGFPLIDHCYVVLASEVKLNN